MANLSFTKLYDQRTGDNAHLDFGSVVDSIIFSGVNSLRFGSFLVEASDRFIQPVTIASSLYGVPDLRLSYRYVSVPSSVYALFGDLTAEHGNRYVYFNGLHSSLYGDVVSENVNQAVLFDGFVNYQDYGSFDITPFNKTIFLGGLSSTNELPGFFIDYRVKTINFTSIESEVEFSSFYIARFYQFINFSNFGYKGPPPSIESVLFRDKVIHVDYTISNVFGAFVVKQTLFAGFTSAVNISNFGFLRVFDNARPVDFLHNPEFSIFGLPSIYNNDTTVVFESILPEEISVGTTVHNKDRYVQVSSYPETLQNPEKFGAHTQIINANRQLVFSGIQTSRFPFTHSIFNNAFPISFNGFNSFISCNHTFDHEHRSVQLSGFVSFVSRTHHYLYNAAKAIHFSSIFSELVPDQFSVKGRNKFVTFNGFTSIYSLEISDLHYADYAVRSIPFGSIEPPYVPIINVVHNPQIVTFSSIYAFRWEAFTVHEHFNIAKFKSANVFPVPTIGVFSIANKNKTVFMRPPLIPDIPRFSYEFLIRYYNIPSISPFPVPQYNIAFRDRTITFSGSFYFVLPVHHKVRNQIPPPPHSQTILFESEFRSRVRFGAFAVKDTNVFPRNFRSSFFGTPTIYRNGCIFVGFFSQKMGTPSFSEIQRATFTSIEHLEPPSKFRVSPHTIYLPSGDQATDQAKANHNSGIANEISPPTIRPFWVSHFIRSIFMRSNLPFSVFGDAAFTLRTRKVHFDGLRSQRIGIIGFLNIPQTVMFGINNDGVDSFSSGSFSVAFPYVFNPIRQFEGLTFFKEGNLTIENFNKNLSFYGVYSFIADRFLVGFHRDTIIDAGILTVFGATWVSHSPRYYTFGGDILDGFQLNPVFGFNDRMRVAHGKRSYCFGGISSTTTVSRFTLQHKNQKIWVATPLLTRFGGFNVKSLKVVSPQSWIDSTIGDIQRWEFGTISVQSFPYTQFGNIKTIRELRLVGINVGSVSTFAVRDSVRFTGTDFAQVPRFTLTANICGPRALAFRGFGSTQFGELM